LIDSVKALNVGIDIRSEKVCILLYADDVVFLCENEDDLQEMLNTLESWCYSNKINVNLEKSKIVHFRTQSVTRSNFSFIFNGKEVDIVSKYTYLNLLLTEFLSSISVRFKPHLRRCCGRCYRKRP
jgi:glycosyltransferase involved in cell wall biosynthesis